MTEVKKYNSYEEIKDKIFPPSFQRDIIRVNVEGIKHYLLSTVSPCIGVIDLARFNGKLYCIDGNHRLTSLKELYEQNIIRHFFCIIYLVNSMEEMRNIFQIRNHTQPIPDFILHPPQDKGVLLRNIQEFLTNIPLIKHVPQGSKCNRPFINIYKFISYIETCHHLQKWETLNDFSNFFFDVNEKIRRQTWNDTWLKKNKISDNMLNTIKEKCINYEKGEIYIGLYTNYEDFDII
jgi:hypothetical protein